MQRLICASAVLVDGGDAVRFSLDGSPQGVPAFVLRWKGTVYAYVNRCAHVSIELDWNPGKFLDDSGLYLVCATHGALYEPDTGRCVAGPCNGRQLEALRVIEREGDVYWVTADL